MVGEGKEGAYQHEIAPLGELGVCADGVQVDGVEESDEVFGLGSWLVSWCMVAE